jgi:mannose-6-phosphate isomerase
LSWQYHKRCAEIWQVFKGTVVIIKSNTDVQNEKEVFNEGDKIILQQGERHRLIV